MTIDWTIWSLTWRSQVEISNNYGVFHISISSVAFWWCAILWDTPSAWPNAQSDPAKEEHANHIALAEKTWICQNWHVDQLPNHIKREAISKWSSWGELLSMKKESFAYACAKKGVAHGILRPLVCWVCVRWWRYMKRGWVAMAYNKVLRGQPCLSDLPNVHDWDMWPPRMHRAEESEYSQ